MFERLKRLYEEGRLNDKGIENAVMKGWITEDQARAILTPVDETETEAKGE